MSCNNMRRKFTNKDIKFKKALKLQKERDKLCKTKRITKIIEPYQRGWILIPDLREDLKKLNDAQLIIEIIKASCNKYGTRDVMDVRYVRRNKERPPKHSVDWRGNKVAMFKRLYSIDKFGDKANKYFYSTTDKYGGTTYFTSIPEWYVVYKVIPNIIDSCVMEDPNVASRKQEIDNYCTTNDLHIWQFTGAYSRRYQDTSKVRRAKLKVETIRLYEDYYKQSQDNT